MQGQLVPTAFAKDAGDEMTQITLYYTAGMAFNLKLLCESTLCGLLMCLGVFF